MEFLDSLDLDTIDKKSHRVRSWYLYEQFKSLERSQLDAAQKLKDRSYQERILRQELSERRARRKLYDQFGLCQSESKLIREKSVNNYRSTVSTSEDDFLESFYLVPEEERVTQITGAKEFSGEGDTFSQDCLSESRCCIVNCESVDDQNRDDNGSHAGSVTSVVENLKPPNDEFLSPPNGEYMQNILDEDIKSYTADDTKSSRAEDTKSFIAADIKNCIADDLIISIADDLKHSIVDDLKNSVVYDSKNSTANDSKNSTANDSKTSPANDSKNSTANDSKTSAADDSKNFIADDSKNSIADDLKKQLDSVKEDLLCLENIAHLEDDDKISEEDSSNKLAIPEHIMGSKKADQECNVIAIWSRVVSFAYQVVQLNHGNCYCDYSSQFLTAVLACDVLRRGVNRMCNILQPYVSPIEFASDDSDASDASLNLYVKRKKSVQSRKRSKTCQLAPLSRNKAKHLFKTRPLTRKSSGGHCSENSKSCYTQSLANGTEIKLKPRGASEPWRGSHAKVHRHSEEISPESSSSSTLWPNVLNKKPKLSRRHSYRYYNRALHPMLKIAQCIDSILKDIDDFNHDV